MSKRAGGEAFRVRGVGRGEQGRPRDDALLGQSVSNVANTSAGAKSTNRGSAPGCLRHNLDRWPTEGLF